MAVVLHTKYICLGFSIKTSTIKKFLYGTDTSKYGNLEHHLKVTKNFSIAFLKMIFIPSDFYVINELEG